MNSSVYTLLIVESPIIAQIIQKLSPSSIYVLATEGYCWKPRYDMETQQIKAVADPTKTTIRKEMKEQAQWANSIVIATDSDPSGDFIAWSIARFMKSNTVKRGRIQSLSKSGIFSMLSDIQEIETDRLETRLKNKYLIKNEWFRQKMWPELYLSGLITVFGENNTYTSFLDENDSIFKSSAPVNCTLDELIEIKSIKNSDHYPVYHPLSTYTMIGLIVEKELAVNYLDAQNLLQQLFETTLHNSNESLISYPRTDARAFYSETWDLMQTQFLKLGIEGRLKPTFLRDIADMEAPHESIHPLDLSNIPDQIMGELTSTIGKLYELIYNTTLKSISIPEPLNETYRNELLQEVFFYSDLNHRSAGNLFSLRPCITIDELGSKMNQLGVLKPSVFGKSLDDWIEKGWIQIKNGAVIPGKPILQDIHKSSTISTVLNELKRLSDNSSLTSETIRTLFTSYS
ncbi:MAG: DNA topoisomerase [Balneolaceae bacterium]